MFTLILCFTFLLAPPLLRAADPVKQYIADDLRIIPVRAGKGMEFKIVTFLTPGAAVTTMDTEDPEWSLISYGTDREGWILSRYLTNRRPAAHLLAAAQQQVAELQKKVDVLTSTNQEYRRGNTGLLTETKELRSRVKTLDHDYQQLLADSAQYLELKEKHDALMMKYQEIAATFDTLSNEKDLLQRAYTIKWFLSGASVVLLGILIGMFIQAMRGRRKRSDSLRLR
ncbi:MAG: TIGR04211 family SH3 domain-containing protein [Deltaproteobacteria bacterium]|nr:TIGR04211 family SH3 domain-containing protein [Candidatus Anaeroferrophillus wilburensis]MBN2888843.1 TIGR04211 family SH3 domain-containing protein [Deltaproteobacteria bacterium]